MAIISAKSARARTRNKNSSKSTSSLPIGILKKLVLIFFTGFLAWAYQATRPPPPKICGSSDGPPITSPRIKLRDASPDLIKDLGVYTVAFDRPGYGESDPDPKRTLKSLALDIEELADQLEIGSKFYVVGLSMGGELVWPVLKYIPHRLAGAALIAPVVNHWWPSFPSNLSNEVYSEMFTQDQWCLRVAHHLPWLTYWWNTQKWFPGSSVASQSLKMFSPPDMEVLSKLKGQTEAQKTQPRQQGEYESLHRDLMIAFGKWEIDPMELDNPFPHGEGSVHLWQGDDDRFTPVKSQRYIAQRLPWINYHELPRAGHLFVLADGMANSILKALFNVKD